MSDKTVTTPNNEAAFASAEKAKFYKWLTFVDAFYAVLHTTALLLFGGGFIFSAGDIGGLFLLIISLGVSAIYMLIHGIVVYIKVKNVLLPNLIALASGTLFSVIMTLAMADDFHIRLVFSFAVIWCVLVGISFISSIITALVSNLYRAAKELAETPAE